MKQSRSRAFRHRSLGIESLDSRCMLTVVVDLDLDGDVDLLSGGVLYKNRDGYGNFDAARFDDDACGVCVVGDLDRDGDPDVVSPEGWHENQGGSLEVFHPWDTPAGFDPVRLRLADVDQNGFLDILAHDRHRVVQWSNQGNDIILSQDRTFVEQVLDVADVDKNLTVDVLVIAATRELVLLTQATDGSYSEIPLTNHGPDFYAWTVDARLADLNGDGWEDVFVHDVFDGGEYTATSQRVNQFANPGQDVFASPTRAVEHEVCWDSCRFQLQDVDADGDLDVLETYGLGTGLAAIHENNGTGTFRLGPTSRDSDRPAVHLAADLNGDGIVDFVLDAPQWFDNAAGAIHVPGGVPPGPDVSTHVFLRQQRTMTEQRVYTIVDLDGDQVSDVLAASPGPAVQFYAASGELLGQVSISYNGSQALQPSEVTARDMNGDGLPDLIARVGSRVYWKPNLGGLRFGTTVRISNASGDASAWGLGDVNGDEAPDVAIGIVEQVDRVRFRTMVNIITSDSSGYRDEFVEFNSRDRNAFLDVSLVDVDGDGDDDVYALIRGGIGYEHHWIENRAGMWQDPALIAAAPRNSVQIQVGVGDVNGDARLDLVYGDSAGLRWRPSFFGDDVWIAREFTAHPELQSQLAIADLDDDGDNDLVVTSETDLIVYDNQDARGHFADGRLLARSNAPSHLTATDLDADGDLDLLMVESGNIVVAYEQRLLGDVNNDGRFDSSDLVAMFAAGEYEDELYRNSTFATGDLDGDGEFNTSDLVFAFQAGVYTINA